MGAGRRTGAACGAGCRPSGPVGLGRGVGRSRRFSASNRRRGRSLRSIRPLAAKLAEFFKARQVSQLTWFQAAAEVPVPMDVEGAEVGGADRALGVLAALRLMPAGRAGPGRFVRNGHHRGTCDQPGRMGRGRDRAGLGVMASALHLRTAQVPLLDTRQFDPHHPPPTWGRGTVSSLTAGIFWGTVGHDTRARGSSDRRTRRRSMGSLGGRRWATAGALCRWRRCQDRARSCLARSFACRFWWRLTQNSADFAGY